MARRKKSKPAGIISVIIIIIIIAGVYFTNNPGNYTPVSAKKSESAFVYDKNDFVFYTVDTGNSDSLILAAPGGEAMLIDAGEDEDFPEIKAALDNLGITELAAIVATHPHADHIGAMDEVIEKIPAEKIYLTDAAADTKTYKNMMQAIEDKQLPVEKAVAGTIFKLGEAEVEIISPIKEYDDFNNTSIVLQVRYGEADFLLLGDSEKKALKDAMEVYDVECDVLKAGHHGSYTSTWKEFLDAASPSIAVICCGAGNSYGHPHAEVIDLFQKMGITILRTDLNGDIAITSDGKNIEYFVAKAAS